MSTAADNSGSAAVKRGRAESPKPTEQTGREPKVDSNGASKSEAAGKSQKKELPCPPEGPSLKVWILILFMDALMLVASNLVFSYSAFKLDLKTRLAWDEPTMSLVWSFANAGMNFMVHLGWIYDRFGGIALGSLAVVLKVIGLGGMAALAFKNVDIPWLFGLCFFLDAQGTASAITVGQSEALRITPASRLGTAVSVAKSAFAVGPIFWTYAYQWFFSPHVQELFFCSGALGAALLAAFCFVVYSVGGKPAQKKTATDSAQGKSLSEILLSFDCAVICGSVSVVTWGSALVWISNISNFAVAGGYGARSAAIQSSFFTSNMLARLAIGPLMDTLPLSKQMWVLICSATMVVSSALMFVSGGSLLPIAAVLAGASFGADASMCPIMCRLINQDRQATLYSFAKVGGLLASTASIWLAGIEAERHADGATNCLGEQCYHSMWVLMLAVSVPSVCVTAAWALRPAKHDKTQ